MLSVVFQIGLLFFVAISADRGLPISAQRSTPVKVGDTAPDFTLEDQDGQKVTLSDNRGKRPVVLVFYRGYW
jgi:cytochrome oxidase Cu insertion factor (SCO1/SenC/PrrC family)